MTVSYTGKVASASGIGHSRLGWLRLLLIWKGSLYKLVCVDYIVWLVIYFLFSIIYRFALNPDQRLGFENWCKFCEKFMDIIPLAFVLGFFVSIMVTRWWSQFMSLPWPDNTAIKMNYVCPGSDEDSRLIRRTVVRYVNLCIVLMLRTVSSKVTKRFPTYQHMVEAGLMTSNELAALLQAESASKYGVYWVPISWATAVTEQAWHRGYIKHSRLLIHINQELTAVKDCAGTILCYDWVNIPIIYTQVVTFGVYFYLVVSLFGRQFLNPSNSEINPSNSEINPSNSEINPSNSEIIPSNSEIKQNSDYIFPIFSSVQLIFYLGWLKVAESLLNPFGEDDDDFDVNMLIDRGLQIAFLMVDDVGRFPPHIEKDKFWKVSVPSELPYTVASIPFRKEVPVGSGEVEVPLEQQKIVNVESIDQNNISPDLWLEDLPYIDGAGNQIFDSNTYFK